MKKLAILSWSIACVLFSCSDTDDSQPVFNLESVKGKYLIDKEEHIAIPAIGGDIQFSYDKAKLVKRTGGYIPVTSSSGYSGHYVTDIYDTVLYVNATTVRIVSKDNLPDVVVNPYEREITLNDGLIERKITAHDLASGVQADTLYYFYDSQQRIKRTEQRLSHDIVIREYFFNSRGNVEKITGVKRSRYDKEVIGTTEETFGGYDDRANPLKGMYFWEDLYYRALSNNNFTTYSYKSGSVEETHTWQLVYDANGNVNYSE